MAKHDKDHTPHHHQQADAPATLLADVVVDCATTKPIETAPPPVTKVRAKMRVERIEPTPNGEAYIHLRPVTSGSPENLEFYSHTPGGACSIGLVSAQVARMFVLNRDYYVDFTPAD